MQGVIKTKRLPKKKLDSERIDESKQVYEVIQQKEKREVARA